MTAKSEQTDSSIVATFTIDGRDYEVIRIGEGNVFGAFPLHTAAELAMQDSARPWVSPVYGAPAEGVEGWLVHDQMNRVNLGVAATYEDIARIAAQDPHRPLV